MPIDPSQPTSQPTQAFADVQPVDPSSRGESGVAGRNSAFGPAYVLGNPSKGEDSKSTAEATSRSVDYTVPLVQPDSPGRTLASLPPLQPMGTATFTEVSLQQALSRHDREKDSSEGG